MKRDQKRWLPRYRVQVQMTLLLLIFTIVTTLATGWIIYTQVSEQVIRDAWEQHASLLDSACMSLNQQIEQMRSFTWQLSNHSGVEMYLHLKEQTPKNILMKKDIIDLLQKMKGFSSTLSDIGFYSEGLDMVITAESSYPSDDYFSRIDGLSLSDVLEIRGQTNHIALCDFVGKATISRIISNDHVLVFISSLPLNSTLGKSYAFFHLPEENLLSCLPESENGVLLLCDRSGTPVISHADDLYSAVCRLYMSSPQNQISVHGEEYGVLAKETASAGLTCMAIVPYRDLLRPTVRLRRIVTLVMGLCMAGGLIGSILVSKRLYTPLERLLESVKDLRIGLPDGGKANEYKLLDDAIHLISDENHALSLSNQEINRLLKNRLLSDWMEGRLRGDAAQALAKVQVSFPYDRIQIAVMEINPRALEHMEKAAGVRAADQIETLAAENDMGSMRVFCAQRMDGRLLVLFNLDSGHPSPETIYAFLNQVRQEIFRDIPCVIGVGRAYGMQRASDSLVDAMSALNSGNGMGDNALCLAEEIPDVPDMEYTLNAEQKLINQMLSGRKDEAAATLHAFCASDTGTSIPRSSTVRALLFTARRVACQAGAEDQFAGFLEQAGFQADDMLMDQHMEERLCQVLFSVMDCLNADASSQEEKQYAKLTKYIQDEYCRDISLETVSEALSMSPSYIGLLFRRVAGTSFLKYLTDTRIAEAKRLLLTTDLTLREIGQMVGIENQNTLIRTFKKTEGITPGQFRIANSSIHSRNG
ncbi:MAG: AraC family transcriptional regulator [Clostridia bacterium]|nr:AraC family transcriptional regulator [Clostridia bacterium]MBR4537420.1 AraC family transcriptional regulator [Clostridia bacterium]